MSKYCEHVYKTMGTNPCPLCGKDTHEIDFAEQARLHKQWWADGKADWSICPDCGGTIRGWWSI